MILATGYCNHPLGDTFEREPGFAWWTLGFQVRGAAELRTRGHVLIVPPRTLAMCRPRTPYRLRFAGNDDAWEEYWVIFKPRPEWADLLAWPERAPGYMVLPAADGAVRPACDALIEVHRLVTGADHDRMRFAENLLERMLLLANRVNPAMARRGHPAVHAALDTIAARWMEPLDVAALARAAGCSPSHLAHLFAAETGTTLKAHLEAERIGRAKHMLAATSLPVREIAGMVGFDNAGHFATRFRRCVGVTPLSYRRSPTAVE